MKAPALKTAKKPTAAERTVSMFAAPAEVKPEAVQEDAKAERVSMEEDADRNIAQVFAYQQWVTKTFGMPSETNQYRIAREGEWLVVQELRHGKGKNGAAYASSLITVHKDSFLELARVVVQAAKTLRDEDGAF